MSYYYLNKQGETVGPFSESELHKLYAAGIIDDNTLIVDEELNQPQAYAERFTSDGSNVFTYESREESSSETQFTQINISTSPRSSRGISILKALERLCWLLILIVFIYFTFISFLCVGWASFCLSPLLCFAHTWPLFVIIIILRLLLCLSQRRAPNT